MALSSFQQLNKIVSVYSSVDSGAVSVAGLRSSKAFTSAPPQTILFLSWNDASPRYIQKYTNLYTKIWPGARIILVRTGVADFFYRTERTSRRLIEPVVEILSDTTDDTLLVHVMSNAGSKQWCTINKLYLQSTGRTLSNARTFIDSAPGRSRFWQTWAALMGSLPRSRFPRIILGVIFGLVLIIMHLCKYLKTGPDLLEVVRTQMNDLTATVKGVRRCYVYSEEDKVIAFEDVVDHANDAERKGWAVELVKFKGSTHVGHFKQSPERYREAIERMWSGKS